MSLITIIDFLFRLYIIIIRKSWFKGLVGGDWGLAKNRFRTDSIRYLTILASIWIDTRYRVFLPSLLVTLATQIEIWFLKYIRVPFANSNILALPPGNEHGLDYLILANMWPIAWYALECAGQVLGDTLMVFGADASIPITPTQLLSYSQVLSAFSAPIQQLFEVRSEFTL